MVKEEWRDIKEYEGFYQVSNLGRVRSIDRLALNKYGVRNKPLKGKILAQRTKDGYKIVHLSVDGVDKNEQVHRLVAKAFIPNPNNLPCVNHKDEVKSNNVVTNLEWCTIEYNNTYGTMQERGAKKRLGKKMPREGVDKMALKHKKKIGAFKDGKLIECYDSAADAARCNPNYNYVSISACCNGRIKTYRGFEWKFINNVA